LLPLKTPENQVSKCSWLFIQHRKPGPLGPGFYFACFLGAAKKRREIGGESLVIIVIIHPSH
jgi:hypothetical protein